eukprot:1934189-Pyramimonas_sp.AAC.1
MHGCGLFSSEQKRTRDIPLPIPPRPRPVGGAGAEPPAEAPPPPPPCGPDCWRWGGEGAEEVVEDTGKGEWTTMEEEIFQYTQVPVNCWCSSTRA